MTLYELTGDYAAFAAALDTVETDEEIDAIIATLGNIEADIVDKAEAYAAILRNKQSDVDALKAEAARLDVKRKTAEHTVERLKRGMADAMQALHTTRIETKIGTWRIQSNPASCAITDEAAIPAEWRIPQPDKIDKAGILRHYKATGELLPGVEIQQTQGIRFK